MPVQTRAIAALQFANNGTSRTSRRRCWNSGASSGCFAGSGRAEHRHVVSGSAVRGVLGPESAECVEREVAWIAAAMREIALWVAMFCLAIEYSLSAMRTSARTQLTIWRPPGMPPTQRITAYGGGTLIFDQYGRLKYHVEHRLDDAECCNRVDSTRGRRLSSGSRCDGDHYPVAAAA